MDTDPSDPSLLVDLERYPLLHPEAERYRACVEEARRQLQANGAAEIPGFISPTGVAELVRDADALAQRAPPRRPSRNSWTRMSAALWTSTIPPLFRQPRRRPISSRSAVSLTGSVVQYL